MIQVESSLMVVASQSGDRWDLRVVTDVDVVSERLGDEAMIPSSMLPTTLSARN